jgi:hypothetical protein
MKSEYFVSAADSWDLPSLDFEASFVIPFGGGSNLSI